MELCNVKIKVVDLVKQVAADELLNVDVVSGEQDLMSDLGFTSINLATLGAHLEVAFEVDPFASNMALSTKIRTVDDVCHLYHRCIMKSKENN